MRGKEALSSCERVRLALEHKQTDRIPIAMVCAGVNPPAWRELDAYLRRERATDARAYLDSFLDIRQIAPQYIGPPLPPGEDMWGVRRRQVSYGAGVYHEIDHYPLAGAETVGDLAGHRWPTTDWFDYSAIPERAAAACANGECCLMIALGSLFETSWYMRGLEQMLLDFVLNPELAQALLERVTEFQIAHFRKMLSAAKGTVDLAFTADDIAGQNGLLMSLETWLRFIKPGHVRLNKAIHDFGVRVIYHSDGAVMDAVEGLLDMGIDVLQALQFDAKGMDPARLKSQYGDRLCFEGGISVQRTLPFGSVEDVRRETRERISVLGRGGGYILGPSHAIQAGTPPENIVAMFDTAAEYYPF